MAKPNIRIAFKPNGDIEAATGFGVETKTLTIDPRNGNVTHSDVMEGTDLFRWLVQNARAVLSF